MSALETPQDEAIFDSSEYEVPFTRPEAPDPHHVLLKLGGSLKLNRNDPHHMAMVERLELGKAIRLDVTATTTNAGDHYRIDDQGTVTVTYVIRLNADIIEQAQ